jgi:transmembrane sensor
MVSRESSAEIDDAAAAWVARIDRAALTLEEDAILQDWLAGDTRRLGAFARARAVMLRLDRSVALGAAYDPEAFAVRAIPVAPAIPRRALLIGGSAMATSLAAASLGLTLMPKVYSTRRGEVRLVPLDDGSAVTLNTASKVAVRYSKSSRDIHLVEGEALFDVAKNPSRPFVVRAGDMKVRAIGTSFMVRERGGRPLEVLVREGVVEVTRGAKTSSAPSSGPSVATLQLVDNERLAAKDNGVMSAQPLEPSDVDRKLAWREGMLSFSGTTLLEAAAEFARYSDPQIVIDDQASGQETIAGLFSANNPAGFAKTVALSLNLDVYTTGDQIHLRQRAE